jgi:phage terminase large subunit-like protein
MSPSLSSDIDIKESAKRLVCKKYGTEYRALSAEASTAYGLSPVFVVHDELGQVKGPRSSLYDALETAVGAHEEPLSIIISTQAPTDSDLLSVLIDDAKTGEDPRVILSLYTADEESDPFTIESIKKANPALGDFLNEREVLAMAADAKRMPSREAEYRNLVLNQRIDTATPLFAPAVWKTCGFDVKEFDNVMPIYAGLDLSAVRDLTAFVMIGKQEDEKWHVKPHFWLPEDGLIEKSKTDKVPYDMWHQQGHLHVSPGKSVDYSFVARFVFEQFNQYNIRKVAFDRWGMVHLRPWLIKAGFSEEVIDEHFQEFGQGTQSMSPALRALEGEVANARVAHGNHPILAMCVRNAVVESKDESNRRLSKAKSTGRIDGAVALTMAFGVAPMDSETVDIRSLIV